MTSLFLSYARDDDEPFVRRLYEDLTARGFDVWFDRDGMRARGLTFIDEIKRAISDRDRFVFIVGPRAVASPWVRMEWEHALAADKCVNPIVRLNDPAVGGSVVDGYSLIPEDLAFLHAEDFRDDLRYEEHLANLVRQLSDPPPPLGRLIAVPSIHAIAPHLISQPDRLRALRDAVISDLQTTPTGRPGEASRVGVRGMPGIGKSVLATVLAHDRRVRLAYPDGIFWLPFGQQPNLVQLQRNIATALGDSGAFENEMQGKAKLRELLLDKAALLICDDVWETRHADPFDVLGPRSRALITTRDAGLLQALKAMEFVVQLLSENDAVALLAKASGTEMDALPPDARDVATECDRLPLALALCGGMAFGPESVGWTSILGALRSAELEDIATDHVLPGQSANLWKAIALSVQQLTPDDQRRWAELSVFPEDETVPETVVGTLWTHTGKMKPVAVETLLKRLANRSLLYLEAKSGGTDPARPPRHVSLHDLLHDYAKRIAGDKATLHQQLLDAYRVQCPDGWATGPDDGYFFVHLRDHLVEAGKVDDLCRLLLDLAWLERKAEIGLVFDLPRDYAECLRVCPADDRRRRNIRLLEQAIRRDIHFIARHPSTVFQCLWNSGWWYDCAEAAQHHESADGPWNRLGDKLSTLLEAWRAAKERETPGFVWVRSKRPPLTSLGSAELAVLRGHEGSVGSTAVTPDGGRIISGSDDHTVRVWDGTNGAELAVLRGHENKVTSVAVTPDGGHIISGSGDMFSRSGDNTVRLWDGTSGAAMAVLRGHEGQVNSVAVTPDGHRIVSGSEDKTVRVWDGVSGAQMAVLRGHEGPVNSVAVTPDERRIISGSGDKTVRVWDGSSGAAVSVLHGHEEAVTSVAVTADGRRIISGSFDRTVRVWDGTSGAVLAVFRGDKAFVTGVAVTADGRRIISGSVDRTVRVWDGTSGAEVAVLRGHEEGVGSVAVTLDGGRIISGSWDWTVRVWDGASGADLPVLRGHEDWVESVAITPDGGRVISGSWDATVRVWHSASGTELAVLRGHERAVWRITVTLDGERIISGSSDGTVRVWDGVSGAQLALLCGHQDGVTSLAVEPDGGRIISGSHDKTVRVWDSRTGIELAVLRGHEGWVTSVAMTPDGGRIISGGQDKTVRVWDGVSGALLAVLRGHEGGVTSVAVTPEGERIISGSKDRTVRLWDGRSGAQLTVLRGHEENATAVAFTPDGGRVISESWGESWDHTVRVWDVATEVCLEVIQGRIDLAAIAAGSIRYPYRALARRSETVIENSASSQEVARFPAAFSCLSTHPSGRAWVGASGNHVYFITLEGDTGSTHA